MISACWFISIATSLPIVLGANKANHQTGDICTFFNPYFSAISSCVSFVIPTVVMMILYYRILRVLHNRANEKSKVIKGRQRTRLYQPDLGSENSEKSEQCNVSSDSPSNRESSSDGKTTHTEIKFVKDNGDAYSAKEGDAEERGSLIPNGLNSSTYQTTGDNNNKSTIAEKDNVGTAKAKTVRVTVLDSQTSKEASLKKTNCNGRKKLSRSNSVFQSFQKKVMRRKEPATRERNAIIMLIVVLCKLQC